MLIHVLALAALFEAFEAPMARVAQTAMKAAAPALVAGALVMGDAGTAFAANAAVGERIFDGNCAACHAGGRNVIRPEKTLERAALELVDGAEIVQAYARQCDNFDRNTCLSWSTSRNLYK